MKNLDQLKHLIDTVYPSWDLFAKKISGKKLRIYYGIDPTGPIVHLGHAIPLRILALLQQMGHHIILLFGDFTARIGDPTGRDKSRTAIDRILIEENVKTYESQIDKILDTKKAEIRFNSEWYDQGKSAGSLESLLELGKEFTAAQLWERDMFQERQKTGQGVTITEFLYPMFQAYDSLMLEADVEVGGTDQTFNMLKGRDLVARKLSKEKLVVTTKMLVGTDGRKMSKSFNNYIGLTNSADEMFGKLMSVKDELVSTYFELAALRSIDEDLKNFIASNPRDAKAQMAREVIALYWSTEEALNAERKFNEQFKEGKMPEDIIEVPTSLKGEQLVSTYLCDLGLAKNKSEAARLISQGGVKVDGVAITDPLAVISPTNGIIFKVGKRKFVKIKVNE